MHTWNPQARPGADTWRLQPVPCLPGQRSSSAAAPRAAHALRYAHPGWPACRGSCPPSGCRRPRCWRFGAPRRREPGRWQGAVQRGAPTLELVARPMPMGASLLEPAAGLVRQGPLQGPAALALAQALPQAAVRRQGSPRLEGCQPPGVQWPRAGPRAFSHAVPCRRRRRLRRRHPVAQQRSIKHVLDRSHTRATGRPGRRQTQVSSQGRCTECLPAQNALLSTSRAVRYALMLKSRTGKQREASSCCGATPAVPARLPSQGTPEPPGWEPGESSQNHS